jgi:hypothetical protein
MAEKPKFVAVAPEVYALGDVWGGAGCIRHL